MHPPSPAAVPAIALAVILLALTSAGCGKSAPPEIVQGSMMDPLTERKQLNGTMPDKNYVRLYLPKIKINSHILTPQAPNRIDSIEYVEAVDKSGSKSVEVRVGVRYDDVAKVVVVRPTQEQQDQMVGGFRIETGATPVGLAGGIRPLPPQSAASANPSVLNLDVDSSDPVGGPAFEDGPATEDEIRVSNGNPPSGPRFVFETGSSRRESGPGIPTSTVTTHGYVIRPITKDQSDALRNGTLTVAVRKGGKVDYTVRCRWGCR